MKLPDEPVPLCTLLSSEEGTVGGALDPAPSRTVSSRQDQVGGAVAVEEALSFKT